MITINPLILVDLFERLVVLQLTVAKVPFDFVDDLFLKRVFVASPWLCVLVDPQR
jgi:hypothetical protein